MFRRTLCRASTRYGQFNPIHVFNFDSKTGEPVNLSTANDVSEFKKMVTNPGPLRICYSNDYLQWYFKAYQERVDFHRKRFGADLSHNSSQLKPQHSIQRKNAEAQMRSAQEIIDDAMVEQGLMDCIERQSHFPQIHIDRASDLHV